MNLESGLLLSWRTTALTAVTGRSPEWELWHRFAATRDPALREQLVQHHARLARIIAARMYASRSDKGLEYTDFHHFALVALIEAIDRFEPARGVRFASYASASIRGAITDGVASLSEQQQQTAMRRHLVQERTALLANEVEQSPERSTALARLAEIAVGLAVGFMLEDTGMFLDDTAALPLPDNAYQQGELRRTRALIRNALEQLEPRERKIISLHYLQGIPFKEIASQLELTPGRVSQLHHHALAALQKTLSGRGLGMDECL